MACSCPHHCQTKKEMRERHGTPEVFAKAVFKALGEISLDEANATVDRYRSEYFRAAPTCQVYSEPLAECMGSVLASELCLAFDGKIDWAEVGQVCWRCATIGAALAGVGKVFETCTLKDYERLREGSGITTEQV
jgi:hypothetical protein